MSNWSGMAPGGQHPVKHGLGFLFSGGLAFLIDASVLTVLTVARHAPDRGALLRHIDRHGRWAGSRTAASPSA